MQYDMQKLERMTLEELKAAAAELGINVRRSHTAKMIAYLILDAQADKRAADVEAKEAERTAKRNSNERKRTRVKTAVQRVNTDNLVNRDVLATVGNAKEEMTQIHEQLKQNPHKANKTVQAVQARQPLNEAAENRLAEKKAPEAEETPAQPQETQPQEEAPQPKKRGRKKKVVEQEAAPAPAPPEQPLEANAPAAKEPAAEQPAAN